MKNHIYETSICNTLVDDILKWNPTTSVLYILINILREKKNNMKAHVSSTSAFHPTFEQNDFNV
jgi:hypothetical protein